ncbi:hypothetical protein BCR42DRAFT_459959 [Absidia repens]|uniref:Dolichyldiphosphatase n=1 Tax=Absidia repens TaxID=90262 RepID=A0A1X2IPC1_9FUNG|nr:hypothetical protein BCR42DRAFT_459959 [Absidia repens]
MPHIPSGDALASLSLTHVQFDANDPIAYAFAYITLAPIAILVFYASIAVSRREVVSILMLLGQLTNELVNALLKEYFQISRPYDHLGTGYGMPSSHSQFVWYFTTFVIIGSLVGVVFGLIWYMAMEGARTMGLVDIVLNTSLAQWLLLRDMRNIDNVLEWEYQNWVTWQASVSRNKISKVH